MIKLPILTYEDSKPQVVPDLSNPESLETTLPIVTWGGKRVQIKQIWAEYLKMSTDLGPVQKRRLGLCCIDILNRIKKSHPDYFTRCLNA